MNEEKEYIVSLPINAFVDIRVYGTDKKEARSNAIDKLHQKNAYEAYEIEWDSNEDETVEEV